MTCQAIVQKTQKPCLRKTKEGSDFCGYHSKKKHSKSNTDPCPICLDSISGSQTQWVTPCCQKKFHQTCIDQWTFMGKSSCPLCRADLPQKDSMEILSDRSAFDRLRSESPETVRTRVQNFRQTHRNADILEEMGPFYVAVYEQHGIFILDTSNGQVTRTQRLEVIV